MKTLRNITLLTLIPLIFSCNSKNNLENKTSETNKNQREKEFKNSKEIRIEAEFIGRKYMGTPYSKLIKYLNLLPEKENEIIKPEIIDFYLTLVEKKDTFNLNIGMSQ
jgi:hypothetical protein